jgi:hypothetical protein
VGYTIKYQIHDVRVRSIDKIPEAVLMRKEMNVAVLLIDHAWYVSFFPDVSGTFFPQFSPQGTVDFKCLHLLRVIVLLRAGNGPAPHYTLDINLKNRSANILQRNQKTKLVLID